VNTNGRLTLTIEETAQRLGISRNLAYERAKTGEICPGLRVIKVGRRLLVSRRALDEVLSAGVSVGNDRDDGAP
jgi:excisionase family DNA binding protein